MQEFLQCKMSFTLIIFKFHMYTMQPIELKTQKVVTKGLVLIMNLEVGHFQQIRNFNQGPFAKALDHQLAV